MAEGQTVLLVFMGGPSAPDAAAASSPKESPFPTLCDVLGIEQADLDVVRFRGAPLFQPASKGSSGPEGVEDYLTIVSLRSILHEARPELEVHSVGADAFLGPGGPPLPALSRDPVAVGVSTTFAFSPESVARVCDGIRERFPDTTVVLGGAGLTLNPDWLEASGAPFGVLGDAEESLPLLIGSLLDGSPALEEIPNLAFRDAAGGWRHTARQQFPIDEISTPRWDLGREGSWPDLVWYESQRGCPFRCTFCSYPNQALSWIGKTPERMADEFEHYASHGVTTIECFDSTMVTPPRRMAAFCDLLLEREVRMRWHCYAHAANLQKAELTRAMFAAGCRSVSIGLESCDDSVLRKMKKHVSPAGIRRGIGNCLEAGLITAVNVIIGFPGETPETYRYTVDALVELDPDAIGCQPFQVRDRTIPILQMENGGLHVEDGAQPYWKHDGMDRVQATQLAMEAQWEIAVRAKRTIVGPVGVSARAALAPLDDGDASRFRRRWINPVVNAYGRVLCYDPRFKALDGFLGRPSSIGERSAAELSRQRDRTMRLWEGALSALASDRGPAQPAARSAALGA